MSATKAPKRQHQVTQIIDLLRKSGSSIPFTTLCERVDQKFPSDVVAAMYALESVGLIEVDPDSDGRSRAYRWVGERPAKRRRASKPADSAT